MSEGLTYFLLGLLFSIPLGIVAILLSNPVQRWLETRSVNLSVRRKRQVEADYKLVKRYHDDPSQFHSYLLNIILLLTLVSAITGLVSGLVISFGYFAFYVGPVVFAAGQILSVVGTFVVVILAYRALQIVARVQKFEEFEAKTATILGTEFTNRNTTENE
jgi:hypothetical protein